MVNTAQHCQLGLLQDSHCAGDFEDSKVNFGSGIFVFFFCKSNIPICWVGKKHTSVSHRSTESDTISLDAGRRLDCHPALDLWCVVLRSTNNTKKPTRLASGDYSNSNKISHPTRLVARSKDGESVIKLIMKGRSPTMRHVSGNHRVAFDWLFDRINWTQKSKSSTSTPNQLADILTKGNFTRDEWNDLLCLFNTSHFSSINGVEAMSKRTQEDAGEERVTAKSKPMMNLVSRHSVRDPNVLASSASESPGKAR